MFQFSYQPFFCLDVSDTLSAICSCVLVYACLRNIRTVSMTSTKSLLIRDYILILSSTGMMAYFMIGVVASVSGYTLSKSTVVSRIFGMLETFLQTYLLTRSSRHTADGNRRESTCISFCALILVISNLTYWLLDSYNKHIITKSRWNWLQGLERCRGPFHSSSDVLQILLWNGSLFNVHEI